VYYFTGINDGHPISDEGCLHSLKEKTESWLNLIFVSSLVAVIICFVNILISKKQTRFILGFDLKQDEWSFYE